MKKQCYWNREEKKYNHEEVTQNKFYTKDDLLEVYYCFKDLDRNEKYFIFPNKMMDIQGKVVFKPKYSGEYPSVIKEFSNLEKFVDE